MLFEVLKKIEMVVLRCRRVRCLVGKVWEGLRFLGRLGEVISDLVFNLKVELGVCFRGRFFFGSGEFWMKVGWFCLRRLVLRKSAFFYCRYIELVLYFRSFF